MERERHLSGTAGRIRVEAEELALIALELREKPPADILAWAVERYSPRLVVVSNYGPGTLVVLHHLADMGRDVPVLHLNTGFEFPETEVLGRKLEERYGLRIREIVPEMTVEEQERVHGPELYRTNPDYCCYLRKALPLDKALQGYDAWVTGIRKSQSETRRGVSVVEWDGRHEMVKVNPLAEWTSEQVWECIRENGIPYHPLHHAGYRSIGCWPCTRPTQEGEDERAGRWHGLAKTECGIHLADFTPKPPTEKDA
jgi:phosphoadenosine phosphosulfate reductase